MYGMNQLDMMSQARMSDMLRDAERIHQVNEVLRERRAARRALFTINVARFWRRAAPRLAAPAIHEAAPAS
ncbi:MAG TPA: hypothetical protein VHK65_03125 [Candidatus Dormibacteraeota bacterium]|nr:hypothetical protein [Candidatus Dormibacteraeota bacterium]